MKVLKVLGVIVVALIALDRLVMCGAGPDGMNYRVFRRICGQN